MAHAAGVVHGALRPSCVFLDGPAPRGEAAGLRAGAPVRRARIPRTGRVGRHGCPAAWSNTSPRRCCAGPPRTPGWTCTARARCCTSWSPGCRPTPVRARPWSARSRARRSRRACSGPTCRPRSRRLLLRLLDPDPAQRPPSIAELSSELARAGRAGRPGRHRRAHAAGRGAPAPAARGGLPGHRRAGLGVHRRPPVAGVHARRPGRRSGPPDRAGPTRPPPLPPGAGGNLAAAVAAVPGGLAAPPPMPMGRALSAPAILTSALAPLRAQPGRGPPPARVLGGGMLSRYGVHPADAGKRRRAHDGAGGRWSPPPAWPAVVAVRASGARRGLDGRRRRPPAK